MKRDIFGDLPLPLALRIEIEENAQRKGLTQSELAIEHRRILEEVRKRTAPGARTDLSATSAKDFAQVNRATKIIGGLYNESHRQVEKRIAVVEAAEAEPERFGPLVVQMDKTDKVNQAYAELRRVRHEESEAIPNNGAEAAQVIVGDFREQGHAMVDPSTNLGRYGATMVRANCFGWLRKEIER